MIKQSLILLAAIMVACGSRASAWAQRPVAEPPVRSPRPVPRIVYRNPAKDKAALQSRFAAPAKTKQYSAVTAIESLASVDPKIIVAKINDPAKKVIELTVKKPFADNAYVKFFGGTIYDKKSSISFKQNYPALKADPYTGIKEFAADARVELGFKGEAKGKYYVSVQLRHKSSQDVELIVAPDYGTGFIGFTFGQKSKEQSLTMQPPMLYGYSVSAEWVVDSLEEGWYGLRIAFADAPAGWEFDKITVQQIDIP